MKRIEAAQIYSVRERSHLRQLPKMTGCVMRENNDAVFAAIFTLTPPHSQPTATDSPTTHYCTVQHHVPIDPYAERMRVQF